MLNNAGVGWDDAGKMKTYFSFCMIILSFVVVVVVVVVVVPQCC